MPNIIFRCSNSIHKEQFRFTLSPALFFEKQLASYSHLLSSPLPASHGRQPALPSAAAQDGSAEPMADAPRTEEGRLAYTDFIESLEAIQQLPLLRDEHTRGASQLAKEERAASVLANERSAYRCRRRCASPPHRAAPPH
jgi:hypothetical protein